MIDTEWITDEELLHNARIDIERQIKNGTMYAIGEEPEPFDNGENFYTIVTLYAQYHKDENKAHELLWEMFKKEYPQYLGDDLRMIDTDKYEGHTEGPWIWIDVDWHRALDGPDFQVMLLPKKGNTVAPNPVDSQLIADAPLLLAEVKRLREALVTVQRSLIWDEKDRAIDGDPITQHSYMLEALVEQVEQVRNDITEMIE